MDGLIAVLVRAKSQKKMPLLTVLFSILAEQAAATAVLDLLKEVQKDMVESAAKAIKERDAAVAAYAELSKKHEALREQVAKAAAQEDLAQARTARSQAAVVEALH